MTIQDLSGRKAARARRDAQVYGKSALPSKAVVTKSVPTAQRAAPVAARTSSPSRGSAVSTDSGRNASRERRMALSQRGKAAVTSPDRLRTHNERRNAEAARAASTAKEKDCGCGCNGNGGCGDAANDRVEMRSALATKLSSQPKRNNEPKNIVVNNSGRMQSIMRRQALSSHGKNGLESFRKGASAAQMLRKQNPEISGRELARTVRSMRSNGATNSATRSTPAGRRRPERPGNGVTGTRVAHSDKTTGDETGLCRTVTGTEYFSSEVFSEFCQTDTPKVPQKVDVSETLRGGRVTSGGRVGRSDKVTGDERGSCLAVTGSEYVGREQYDTFCQTKPEPGSAKVSFSQTTRGLVVSGSKPARARQVTGNEAGTCKAVTGTPYAGSEQYQEYCETGDLQMAQARSFKRSGNAGRDITGLQPGLSGLTGNERGACRTVSGTPYIGNDQMQDVCALTPAQPGERDYPRPMTGAPWGAFSLVPPMHASQTAAASSGVTGTRYEQGRISGTFSLAEGKVTGTEQFRFGDRKSAVSPSAPATVVAADKSSRVTGEGLDTGLKITGDDWNRGKRVTGTEGTSARGRNPTRRGPISASPAFAPKRNEEVERTPSKVTGSSGSTEKGAHITVSGGARG